MKKAKVMLCIALALCLISSIGAYMIQTDGGNVSVRNYRIPTDNGRYLSITLYKPDSATKENPAPVVIASPGTYNTKEMQDVAGIELSRRGMVVITFDPYFHGHSSSAEDPYTVMPYSLSGGQIELVEYARTMLDYVDTSRVGVTGHSMGGRISMNTANYYSGLVMDALAAAEDPDSDGGATVTEQEEAAAWELMKINASFPIGSTVTEEIASKFLCNIGICNGIYDEAGRTGEYLLVNSGLPEESWVTKDTLEWGKFYGDASNGTLRAAYHEAEIHPWNHFSKPTARNMINFFYAAFQMDNPIDVNNQVWLAKELFNGLGLLGMILLICPLCALFLELPFFSKLKNAEPAKLPALTTPKSKAFFWGGWTISWLVSWASLFPVSLLAKKIFPVNITSNAVTARLFSQNITNGILLWALFNAIVGVILFIVSYRMNGKEGGVTPEMWGLKISFADCCRTLLLALCVYFAFYGVVYLSDKIFNTDYRLWILAIKTVEPSVILRALRYALLFFPFYLVNSLLTNAGNRVDGQNETLNVIICGLGNVLGILIPTIIQYTTLFATGKVAYTDWNFPLLQATGLIIWLFMAAFVARRCFKMTGKIWLGAMVNCMIIVSIGCFNTMQHVPL